MPVVHFCHFSITLAKLLPIQKQLKATSLARPHPLADNQGAPQNQAYMKLLRTQNQLKVSPEGHTKGAGLF